MCAPQDVPRLSLRGTTGEGKHQHVPWRCTVLPSEEKRMSSMTLQLPALSGHASDGKARGDGKFEKGRGNRASNIFSAVSNLIQSISQFANACMFSLPNLAAL